MLLIELIQVILPYLLVFFIGYWIAGLLGVYNTTEKVGLSWLLGTSWITVTSFLLHVYLKQAYTYPFAASVLVLSFAIFGLLRTFEVPKISYSHIKKLVSALSTLERAIILLLLFFCGYSVIQNIIWPIHDWDSLALYDFRAKVMITTGSYTDGYNLGYFFQYPPYTSLLHTLSYLFGSQDAKLWYSLLFGSFLLLFYYHLANKVSRIWSLFGTLLLSLSPYILEHSMVAYTNLSYTVYVVLSFIYIWKWLETHQRIDLVIGSLLVALSLWVRLSEPFWLVAVLLIIAGMIITRSQLLLAALCILLILGFRSLWPSLVSTIVSTATQSATQTAALVETVPQQSSRSFITALLSYVGVIGNVTAIINQPSSQFFTTIHAVTDYMLTYVTKMFRYLLLPWAITAFIDISRGQKLKVVIQSGTIVSILLLIWLGTYIFSFTFETWAQIGGSASRMSMFIPPLIIYTVMTSSIWQKNVPNRKK